ncbi:hypothetical protein EMMF5_006556 [Cystobasidiomycetes sp. EMM_F5]
MKFTSTFLAAASLVGSVVSQNSTNSSTYVTGLTTALNSANLTILAQLLAGQPALATALQTGNYSVFAPSNAALTAFVGNASLSSINASVITQILSYHVTPAAVRLSALSTAHTIVPSLLQENLTGAPAPIVAYNSASGPVILTAARDVSIGANTTYQNLLVHIVNGVLTPPLALTSTLAAANLTTLATALTGVNATIPATLDRTPRVTVFAPNNAAFTSLGATIAQLNATQISNVLFNHVITVGAKFSLTSHGDLTLNQSFQGAVVYSTNITNATTASSARGQPFRFTINNGSVFVQSGNATAVRIVRPDIPTTNGVVHIIDGVLANPL